MKDDPIIYDDTDEDDRKRIWTTKELLMDSAVRHGALKCAACPDGIATVQLVGEIWKKQTLGSWVCASCWQKSPEQLAEDIFVPKPQP
jgi:hypothetical protein